MGVAVEVEVGEIRERFSPALSGELAHPDQSSKTLSYFDVYQVGRVKLVPVSNETRLNPGTERCLQEELEEGRRVEHNHAESRSSRMMTAAGVFRLTRLRLWILVSISSRVGRAARRSSSARR